MTTDRNTQLLRLLGPLRQPTAAAPEDAMLQTLRRLSQTVCDPRMLQIYRSASEVSRSRLPVLLTGETGVGKDRLAEFIHHSSDRQQEPFVSINCAAVSESLFESELFGHERGAFTGADRAKAGLLESAQNGTLFLDEVGELSPTIQAKLLRVLESGGALRVGGLEPRPIHARFISATNRDLQAEVERGTFRRDLFHRLAGVRLDIPPLRERQADILPLAERFLIGASRELGLAPLPLSPDAIDALLAHRWSGNIRELRHAIQRGLLFGKWDGAIRAEHLCLAGVQESPGPIAPPPAPSAPAHQTGEFAPAPARARLSREQILAALAACGGNQTRAAARLGVGRRTLSRWLDAMVIPRPRKG